MLVLSRKRGQVIWVGSVELTVLKVGENRVVLGFMGPKDVIVRRAEKMNAPPAANDVPGNLSAATLATA